MNCAASICAQHTRLFKSETMRYVVLDTNALIQALPTKSRYHKIWTDFNRLKQITFPRLMVLTLDEFNESLQG